MTISSLRAVLVSLILTAGCTATPPPDHDGSFPPKSQGKYVSIAHCSPSPPCPGVNCAGNMKGAPDGKMVDLAKCATMDLIWTGGNVVAQVPPSSDIALHMGRVAGITRVEASDDGNIFKVVGFIGGTPAGTPSSCLSPVQGTRVLISLDDCNAITNVAHLRLTRDTGVKGAAAIDAAEALNFRPSKF